MTVRFLKYKMQEFELLRKEIAVLKRDAEQKGLLEGIHE